MRSRPQWEAQKLVAHEQTTKGLSDSFMVHEGVKHFDHPYDEVPFNFKYHPGFRFPMMKMHVLDEGPCSKLGSGVCWSLYHDKVATWEEILHANESYTGYQKYGGERPLQLRKTMLQSTQIEIVGSDGKLTKIWVPAKFVPLREAPPPLDNY